MQEHRETKETDKESWGYGPWIAEADHVWWIDPGTGYRCEMVRNHTGAWCGYVGVPEGHLAYGMHYEDVNADVHGGLTFSGYENDVWNFGFDCSHAWDYMPKMEASLRLIRKKVPSLDRLFKIGESRIYRDEAFVKREIRLLRDYLKEMDHARAELPVFAPAQERVDGQGDT